MYRFLQIYKSYAIIVFSLIISITVIYCSLLYAQHINLFSHKKIVVLGNKYVKQNIILDTMKIKPDESIFSVNLDELQDNLETIDFIKSIQVSRILPSTLVVQVLERSPVILVLLDNEKYFFDIEGTPLLASKEAINFFPVPIMTFVNDEPLKLGDYELTAALRFINKSKIIYKDLYTNLSEVRYKNNDLSLITDGRTRIDLGENESLDKISILKEFQNTVKDKRSLNDYAYINLKIDNQIIVREQ